MPRRWRRADLRAALGRPWDDLRREHVADHRALFDRVAFSLDVRTPTASPAGRRCRRTSAS